MGAFPSEKVQKYAPPCWFPLSHLEALKTIKGVKLKALCDQNSSLLEKVKNVYGPHKFYTKYQEMLKNPT